jgi:hypothetical protein
MIIHFFYSILNIEELHLKFSTLINHNLWILESLKKAMIETVLAQLLWIKPSNKNVLPSLERKGNILLLKSDKRSVLS